MNSLPFSTDQTHGSVTRELERLASGYLNRNFSPRYSREYSTHLDVCTTCRGLVQQYIHGESLSFVAVESREPRPSPQPVVRPNPAVAVRPSPGSDAYQGWMSGKSWVVAVAMLALLAVGMTVWNAGVYLRFKDREHTAAAQHNLLSAMAGGAAVYNLAGAGSAPVATGSLVQSDDGETAYLLVQNLPRLPRDRAYQVWQASGDRRVSIGTFVPSGAETDIFTMPLELTMAERILVTVEGEGGSAAPSGETVMEGERPEIKKRLTQSTKVEVARARG
ncbi:MAG: anti-sigma factor [SAR202 cluster bacterium]|nr:anti-sigma factor [SAR202 cluster bacterium]